MTRRAPPADRAVDDVRDAPDLLLVDDRPELDVLAVRVAHAQALGLRSQRLDVVAGHALVDDVAPGREADLALELER